MAIYNINITFSTDGEPTDLELGDITMAMSEILSNPQVESPAGGWVPADFGIDEFVVDLYEESGERVWRHSLNPDGLLFALHQNNLPTWCSPSQPQEMPEPGLPPAQAWLYRLFRRWDKQ